MTAAPLRICMLDVCGTLYDESTTSGFVRFFVTHHLKKPPLRYQILERLRRRPFRTAVIAAGKATGRDYFRQGYISVLKGHDIAVLNACATDYAEYLERNRAIEPVEARITQAMNDGWTMVLASNSLDVVIAAIAKRRGYDWCASSLEIDGTICAGRLKTDLKSEKLKAVKNLQHLHLDEADTMVVTDNKSDQDLIAFAKHVVLVAKTTERGWMKGLYDELICH